VNRKSIDLMELHRNFTATGKRRHTSNPTWIKMVVFLIAVPIFFLLGYWIAALSLSTPMKVLIAFPVAILGIILSYVVSSVFR
jgi:RsiW-degrading membrane proteinase PrsW (M82 family)